MPNWHGAIVPETSRHVPSKVPADWCYSKSDVARVIRGGAFGDLLVNCEAVTRRWKLDNTRKPYLGFRVAVSLSAAGTGHLGKSRVKR